MGTNQEETEGRARIAQAAAAESLKNELPRWLAPQLEQLTHELMAHLAREGALQRDQHEKQLASAQETLQTMCTQAEEAAAKLRTQAEQVESETAARLEAAKQQAGEAAGGEKGSLGAVLNESQQKVSATFEQAENSLREQIAQEVRSAQQ